MTVQPCHKSCLIHLLVSDGALEDTFLEVMNEGAAGPVATGTSFMVGLAVTCLVFAVVSGVSQLVQSMGVVTSERMALSCTEKAGRRVIEATVKWSLNNACL